MEGREHACQECRRRGRKGWGGGCREAVCVVVRRGGGRGRESTTVKMFISIHCFLWLSTGYVCMQSKEIPSLVGGWYATSMKPRQATPRAVCTRFSGHVATPGQSSLGFPSRKFLGTCQPWDTDERDNHCSRRAWLTSRVRTLTGMTISL